MNGRMKVCFAGSSGGHFEQIMCLEELMNRYDCFILTEETNYRVDTRGHKAYFVKQINRKEKGHWRYFLEVCFASWKIYRKEKPDIIICTGVLAMLPMCILCKLHRKKVIFIESFAKSESKTKTGSLVYYFADVFYVQWASMKKLYPRARYLGSIY